jgi:opacity protein-like surface antigen
MRGVPLGGYFTLGLLVASLGLGPRLAAQVALTEPAAEVDVADQGEPIVDVGPEPVAQTSPDDGSLVIGGESKAPTFNSGRRLHLEGSFTGGYDDNVNLRSEGSPSWYASPTALLSYSFGSQRLALTLTTGGGITYYFDEPDGRDYDPNVYLRLALSYKLNPRLSTDVTALASYQGQPDFSTEFSANRRHGNFFRSLDNFSLRYELNPRFSTTGGYSLAVLEYESSEASFLNRIQHTFHGNARFLWLPTTAVLGEYRLTTTSYEDGMRDSTSHKFLAGIEQTFSPQLEASLRAGVQFRMPDQGADRTSPYVEGAVTYRLPPRASITWTNRYSIEESDTPDVSGRTTFRTHLELNYAFTARISASLLVTYSCGENDGGSSSTQQTFDIGPALRYAITPHLSVNIGYRHTEVDRGSVSTVFVDDLGAFRSFERNRYFAGITLKF